MLSSLFRHEERFQAGFKDFEATLSAWRQTSAGSSSIPLDVPKISVARYVEGEREINGFAFRTSLFLTGKGYHYLLVNKRMQAAPQKAPRLVAQFRLELTPRSASPPCPRNPAHPQRDCSLRRWFDQLNYHANGSQTWLRGKAQKLACAAPNRWPSS